MSPGRALAGHFLALALVLALALAARAQPPTLAPVVLRTLPHDPSAFTQGLALHQGALYESTGLYGQSSLRRLDPETGRALGLRRLPGRLFGEGLGLCPERPGATARLVQLTWREGLILTYDPGSLRPLSSHALRGEGWGLACDGPKVVLSDGSDTLRLLDARTFAETGRLPVREGGAPVSLLNELEWVGGWILANVLGQDRIAVIRPPGAAGAGEVAAWIDLTPLRRELAPAAEAANGVAWDPAARELHVTGKRWDKRFVLAPPALLTHPSGP